jgi:O-antigen/teichoic acid export membrane protein
MSATIQKPAKGSRAGSRATTAKAKITFLKDFIEFLLVVLKKLLPEFYNKRISMSTPLAKPLFLLTLAEILFNISGYVIHAVAGRVLGPAEYGRYGLVVTLTTTVIILIGNGIPTAMSRSLSEYFEKDPGMVGIIKRAGARIQFFLIGGVTILFFLLAPLIATLLGDASLTPLFRFSSPIIPAFAASSFYFYYFTGIHLFHYQAILKMARSVLRIVVTVTFVVLYKIYGAIAGYILVPFLTFLLGIFFDRKTSAPFKDAERNQEARIFPWKDLLASAWPITIFLLFYEIFISIDLYLVKALLRDDVQTGLYNAALTLGRLPHYLFYALSIVLLPALAKLKSDGDPEKIARLISHSLRYAGILLLPLFILLFAYAEPTLTLFFGSKYTDATEAFQILAFGLSFLTVFYVVCSGLIGIGRARFAMWMAIAGTAMNTALNFALVPSFGIIGSAWSTTISSTLITLATLLVMQYSIRTPLNIPQSAKVLGAGILLFFATKLFPATSLYFLIPATLLGLGYLALLFWLRVLTREDLGTLLAIFQRKQKTDL